LQALCRTALSAKYFLYLKRYLIPHDEVLALHSFAANDLVATILLVLASFL